MLGTWGACSLSFYRIGSQTGNTIAPLTPERQQLHRGSPAAGVPHVRPRNLEQLPSPRQQLGPAGHKSRMTPAEPGRRLLRAAGGMGGGRSRQAGAQKHSPSPHPPNPTPAFEPRAAALHAAGQSVLNTTALSTPRSRGSVGLWGRLRVSTYTRRAGSWKVCGPSHSHTLCGPTRRPALAAAHPPGSPPLGSPRPGDSGQGPGLSPA